MVLSIVINFFLNFKFTLEEYIEFSYITLH